MGSYPLLDRWKEYHMPKRLIYQVCLGEQANSKLYKFCIESVKDYCQVNGIDHFLQDYPLLRIAPDPFMSNRSKEATAKHGGFLPIYEKENAFNYLNEYDEIAVIDADVYIRQGAANIFESMGDGAFGAVVEREMPLTQEYLEKIVNYSRMQFTPLQDVDWKWQRTGAHFANMGVMVFNKKLEPYLMGQDAKAFLNRYEFKRFVDGIGAWKWSTDQVLLNYWIKKNKIPFTSLPWKFNGLFTANRDINACDFVHFFLKDKLPHKGEDVAGLLQMI